MHLQETKIEINFHCTVCMPRRNRERERDVAQDCHRKWAPEYLALLVRFPLYCFHYHFCTGCTYDFRCSASFRASDAEARQVHRFNTWARTSCFTICLLSVCVCVHIWLHVKMTTTKWTEHIPLIVVTLFSYPIFALNVRHIFHAIQSCSHSVFFPLALSLYLYLSLSTLLTWSGDDNGNFYVIIHSGAQTYVNCSPTIPVGMSMSTNRNFFATTWIDPRICTHFSFISFYCHLFF